MKSVHERVMEDCFNLDVLRDAVPRMDNILDGAALIRDLHMETQGFSQDRNFQSIAHINTELMIVLEQLHDADCTCGNPLFGYGGCKPWFHRWLNSEWGRAFKTKH